MIICNFCKIKSGHSISPLMQNIFIAWFTFNIGFQIFDIKYVTEILKDLEKNKILLDNQEKIMKLYQKWKKENDENSKKLVKEFLDM